MKFRSIHKFFMTRLPSTEHRVERGGQITIEKRQGASIEFNNYVYETTDEKKIEFLKSRPTFGTEIFEVKEGEEQTPTGDGTEPTSVPAKTKNDMRTYLVTEKKVDANELAGKKNAELADFALKQFNVKFV